jgi:signal transduction histidine kinase
MMNSYIAELALQMSHDIRSPLSALNMVIGTMDEMPEEKRKLAKAAIQRINDIAADMLKVAKCGRRQCQQHVQQASQQGSQAPDSIPTGASKSTAIVCEVVEMILNEKLLQTQYNGSIEFRSDLINGKYLLAEIESVEFGRAISNLINNSCEALNGHGIIELKVYGSGSEVFIEINDNGAGIPDFVLNRLGQKGLSVGKESAIGGLGLGIPHAKATIERCGGRFEITSSVGIGTQIVISLPLAEVAGNMTA